MMIREIFCCMLDFSLPIREQLNPLLVHVTCGQACQSPPHCVKEKCMCHGYHILLLFLFLFLRLSVLYLWPIPKCTNTWIHHTVVITLAFLYHVNNGFSPLFVSVSSTSAHLCKNSSCDSTLVNLPVRAWYTCSMTWKSVGKRISK